MDDNYVPCGDEWKKCVMKLRKAEIVEMLKQVCLERDALRDNSNATNGADDVERLEAGLRDIHDRLTGKRGNKKWVVGHIENLLAGRKHCNWE